MPKLEPHLAEGKITVTAGGEASTGKVTLTSEANYESMPPGAGEIPATSG